MDSVSNLVAAIQLSLSKGILKAKTFNIEFPRHMFNFLFNNKGIMINHKPGKLYNMTDFDMHYFKVDSFTHYNKFGEKCSVKFPIYMCSYVRYSIQSYDSAHAPLPRTFTESLFC